MRAEGHIRFMSGLCGVLFFYELSVIADLVTEAKPVAGGCG